jgi:hypothetical protein
LALYLTRPYLSESPMAHFTRMVAVHLISRIRKVRGRIADQVNRLRDHFGAVEANLAASNLPGAAHTSTADPEEWHRSGTLSRSGTPRWRTREEKRPHRLTIPHDALPARLSYFCLLAMASPPLDARRNPLISQHTSGIVRGADSRSIDCNKLSGTVWVCKVLC